MLGEQQFCQVVPQTFPDGTPNPVSAGYKVVCNSDGTATLSFHQTAQCLPDGQVVNIVQQGACVENAPGWGAQSFRVTCNPQHPVGVEDVRPGLFLAQWMESANCDPQHQTHVLGPSAVCQTVPQRNYDNQARELWAADMLDSYHVDCFADGTGGTISFSSTSDCTSANLGQTTFTNGQCISNPANYGSRSVRFFCAGPGQPGFTPLPGTSPQPGGSALPTPRPTSQPGQPTPLPPFPSWASTHAVIRYFEKPDCSTNGTDAHRTLIVARQGFCQRVPDVNKGCVSPPSTAPPVVHS